MLVGSISVSEICSEISEHFVCLETAGGFFSTVLVPYSEKV